MLVEVEDGRIAAVASGTPAPPPGARRLDGLTLPGLANAHSHAFQRALRGRTQHGSGSFWTWREQMYALAERLDPDSYLALARATYAEMALAGVTTVGEFHYLHHGPRRRAVRRPERDGPRADRRGRRGRRADHADRLAATCTAGSARRRRERSGASRDGSAEAWAERVEALDESESVRIGAAIHSMRAVDPEAAATVAAWARERDAPAARARLRAARRERGLPGGLRAHAHRPARRGRRARRELHRRARHPPRRRRRGPARRRGARAAACARRPSATSPTASAAMRRLVDAGASLSLGSDSHAVIDMFEEARAVELDERLASGERGHHTSRGSAARRLGGRARLPRLAGRRADRAGRPRRTS